MGDFYRSRGRRPLALWVSVFVLAGVIAAAGATSATASDKDKCKAEDTNGDGVYTEGETQECGGEVTGMGGNDGANLPHADDGNTHQYRDRHWTKPSNMQRKIIIRNSLAGDWVNVLPNVRADWGNSSKFSFVTQQAENSATARQNCSLPNNYGRVRVCNAPSYPIAGAGAATLVANSKGHLQRARVRVEDGCCKRPLLCQEMGHTLGLDHRATTGSCMHQNAGAAASSPDRHDYEQLENQTHHHGGESDTGGSLSDLDIGGGFEDGCSSFFCTTEEISGMAHGHIRIEIVWHYRSALRLLFPTGGSPF